MANCYLAIYENCISQKQHYFLCANSMPSTEPFGCGVRWVVDGNYPFPNDSVKSTTWSQVPSADISYVPTDYRMSGSVNGSCSGCSTTPYDCINGVCTPNTTYNTPGLYQSLADCQAVCANGGSCGAGKQCVDPTTFCPPGKVCLEQSEVNDINNLLAKIQSEACH